MTREKDRFDGPIARGSQRDGYATLISPAQAEQEVAAGAQLYDVRWEHRRFDDGVIPGSVHLDRDAPGRALATIDKDARVILVCNTDGGSRAVADALVAEGFTNVAHIEGGFVNWKQQGRAVDRPSS
jgi:rhodanese-related sulfurtransferase